MPFHTTSQNSQAEDTMQQSPAKTILFDTTKRELFTPSSGLKTLQARLKVHWGVGLQQDSLTAERLSGARVVVFGGPRDKFSTAEVSTTR